jgi:hypothetical protein
MAEIPHIALPIRFVGSPPRLAVVEQDSAEEIEQGVEAVVRTRIGQLPADPTFGTTDLVFSLPGDETIDQLLAEVEKWEPRATTRITDGWDFPAFIREIGIHVRTGDPIG